MPTSTGSFDDGYITYFPLGAFGLVALIFLQVFMHPSWQWKQLAYKEVALWSPWLWIQSVSLRFASYVYIRACTIVHVSGIYTAPLKNLKRNVYRG